jgi:hypothetical protein
VEIEQDDETLYRWLVTVNYNTQPKLASSVDPNGTTTDPTSTYQDNPLLKPAQWRMSSIDVEEPVTEWRLVDPSGNVIFKPTNIWTGVWQGNIGYLMNQYATNGADAYRCSRAGTSQLGGTGPIGQGIGILDGDPGAGVLWDWWSSAADALNNPNFAALALCASSGGMPFDPPVMTTVSKPTIQVTKNVPSLLSNT